MTDEWKHLSEAEYKQTAEKIGEAAETTQKISDEAFALAKEMYLSRTKFDASLRIAQSAIDAAHDKALADIILMMKQHKILVGGTVNGKIIDADISMAIADFIQDGYIQAIRAKKVRK